MFTQMFQKSNQTQNVMFPYRISLIIHIIIRSKSQSFTNEHVEYVWICMWKTPTLPGSRCVYGVWNEVGPDTCSLHSSGGTLQLCAYSLDYSYLYEHVENICVMLLPWWGNLALIYVFKLCIFVFIKLWTMYNNLFMLSFCVLSCMRALA